MSRHHAPSMTAEEKRKIDFAMSAPIPGMSAEASTLARKRIARLVEKRNRAAARGDHAKAAAYQARIAGGR